MNTFINNQQIERVVHFTTNIGLIGVLNSECVKSRKGLNEDDYLCHILHKNCTYRSDPAWVDYISMSIQQPNKMFFNYASRWDHNSEFWWCVLSFSPEILTHDGVVFCTTNNSYIETVKRETGLKGLQALYANTVKERPPYVQTRNASTPLANPTSLQAEVLYPKQLGLEYLDNIYLPSLEYEAEALAYMAGAQKNGINYTVDPGFF